MITQITSTDNTAPITSVCVCVCVNVEETILDKFVLESSLQVKEMHSAALNDVKSHSV